MTNTQPLAPVDLNTDEETTFWSRVESLSEPMMYGHGDHIRRLAHRITNVEDDDVRRLLSRVLLGTLRQEVVPYDEQIETALREAEQMIDRRCETSAALR